MVHHPVVSRAFSVNCFVLRAPPGVQCALSTVYFKYSVNSVKSTPRGNNTGLASRGEIKEASNSLVTFKLHGYAYPY